MREGPGDMPKDPMSPNAATAVEMHELFTNYMDAGFTREESMQIILTLLRAYGGGR